MRLYLLELITELLGLISNSFKQWMEMNRNELPKLIVDDGVGVELGVANGEYSDIILKNSKLRRLYSIDSWNSRGHQSEEYIAAVRCLSSYGLRSVVMRMMFSEAVKLFSDEHFDFIYIDGYAHEGEDGGRTFYDWWPKVKVGGIFGGHDYDDTWAYNKLVIDNFVREKSKVITVIDGIDSVETGYNWGYAKSWFITK